MLYRLALDASPDRRRACPGSVSLTSANTRGRLFEMPPNILPNPSDFSAGWFFTLYAGLLVVSIAVVWALWTGSEHRNWLPSMLIVGGFLCSLLEPMLDRERAGTS
jgi:hypothetical protein